MAASNHHALSDAAEFLSGSAGRQSQVRSFGYALLVLLIAVSSLSRADVSMELRALDGEYVNLNQYIGNGNWVLVMLWATDCAICKREKPAISAFHDKHRHKDALVLGVALDGYDKIAEIRRYLVEHKPSFPTLVGNIARVSVDYRMLTSESLRGTPTYLLFSPAGELLGNNPGPVRPAAVEAFMARRGK